MEANEEGEMVEVEKEELVPEKQVPISYLFSPKLNGTSEAYQNYMAETFSKKPKKAVVRLNNGDVAVVDRDKIPEECLDPKNENGTRVPGFMWFTKDHGKVLGKMHREKTGYDPTYGITSPWWSA